MVHTNNQLHFRIRVFEKFCSRKIVLCHNARSQLRAVIILEDPILVAKFLNNNFISVAGNWSQIRNMLMEILLESESDSES